MFDRPLSTTAAISSHHLTQPSTTHVWANADLAVLNTDPQHLRFNMSTESTTFNLDMLHYPESPSDSNFSTTDDQELPSDHNNSTFDMLFDDATNSSADAMMQIFSTQEAEQSFIYGCTTVDGGDMLTKMSQEYDDECSILDEVNLISEHGFYYPPGTSCKQELSIDDATTAATVINPSQSPLLPMEELSTVLNYTALPDAAVAYQFSDVMLSTFPFVDHQTDRTFANQNNNYKTNNYKVLYTQPNIPTPDPSPKFLPLTADQHECFDQENQVHSEHNYNATTPHRHPHTGNANNNNLCKRKLQLIENDPSHLLQNNHNKRKLFTQGEHLKDSVNNHSPAKKAKIIPSSIKPLQQIAHTMRHKVGAALTTGGLSLNVQVAAAAARARPVSLSVNTPDLDANMLVDLEQESGEYDLVNFINSTQVNKKKWLRFKLVRLLGDDRRRVGMY